MRWLRLLVRKFKFTAEEVADARRRISAIARTVAPAVQLNVIKEDPDDDKILECAVTAGSDYIVSGDKDLLELKKFRGIEIVRASEFLEILQK